MKPLVVMILAGSLIGLDGKIGAQTYNNQGKQDPFLALEVEEKVAQILEPPPLEKRPPGLAGLLISEVSLVGRAFNNKSNIAILRGIDNFTYFARVGSRLFDGSLEKIVDDEAIFTREIVDTLGNKKMTKVIKRLGRSLPRE